MSLDRLAAVDDCPRPPRRRRTALPAGPGDCPTGLWAETSLGRRDRVHVGADRDRPQGPPRRPAPPQARPGRLRSGLRRRASAVHPRARRHRLAGHQSQPLGRGDCGGEAGSGIGRTELGRQTSRGRPTPLHLGRAGGATGRLRRRGEVSRSRRDDSPAGLPASHPDLADALDAYAAALRRTTPPQNDRADANAGPGEEYPRRARRRGRGEVARSVPLLRRSSADNAATSLLLRSSGTRWRGTRTTPRLLAGFP